jgi:outer membrane protein
MSATNSTVFRISVIVLLVLMAAAISWTYLQQPCLAYVRSHDLIEKYKGTIEARSKFEKRKADMTANVDSLRLDFERARNYYIDNAARMTAPQRMEQEKMLGQRQGQLMQYGQAIDQKVQEEDARMMQEVLNQVNSYVEEYAIKHGYDIVMGTTLSGSLLYGKKSLDVTDDLLEALNNHYQGKP